MSNTSVKELVKSINDNRTQASSSMNDETRVMKAMLNDPTFKVDVWGKSGIQGQYCPYDQARVMVANIIKDTTKISSNEATELASSYEFGNAEANIMIGISKEFINTYVETGRKLPLGGRETSDIAIAKKVKEARTENYPKKVGTNEDGTDKYESVSISTPEHGSLKVYSPTPSWLK